MKVIYVNPINKKKLDAIDDDENPVDLSQVFNDRTLASVTFISPHTLLIEPIDKKEK